MLNTTEFGRRLEQLGFKFYSGVPCSFLKNLINHASNQSSYIAAANEGDAVATCAGAFVGGQKAVVLMQNSGLANAISPLTSLNHVFRIPILGLVSLRGEPGLQDEPQHGLMGSITPQLLSLMKIKWEILSSEIKTAFEQLERASRAIDQGESFFLIVRKGTFDAVALDPHLQQLNPADSPIKINKQFEITPLKRWDVLAKINKLKDNNTAVLATTGYTSRELYETGDAPNNFYMVGSLGCISPMAMGLALTTPEKKIIAIDGDGSVLMRMGALATTGYYHPANLLHILLDNKVYESTGNQPTVASRVDFIEVFSACGYPRVIYIHNLDELENRLTEWINKPQLTFLYIPISSGTIDNLGRPTITPIQVKERLIEFIHE